MKERLLHILDETTCLTRRQMKDYLAGTMLPEEIHAAEAHIASCPLCNMALEGFENNSEEALEAIATLNSGFLKEHFDAITPQIHLNSLSPATVITRHKRKAKTISLGRLVAAAAVVLLAVGLFWYFKYGRNDQLSGMIAQRDITNAPVPAAVPPAPVRIADSIIPQPTTSSRSNTAALDEPAPIIKEAKKAAPEKQAEVLIAKNEVASKDMAATDSEPANRMAAPAEPVVAISKKYAKPLVEFKSPPKNARSLEEVEKSATTNQANVAALSSNGYTAKNKDGLSLGGGRTNGTTVIVDGVQTAPDNLKRGDELFGAGKYSAALKSYHAEMNSSNSNHRSKASLMVAKCYINLGQKTKGIEQLQRVVKDGNGPQRRQAKRLLRDLQDDKR